MKPPQSFTSPKYPKFIRKSALLAKHPPADKVFHYLGLPDRTQKISKLEFAKLFPKPSATEIGLKFIAFLRYIDQEFQAGPAWNDPNRPGEKRRILRALAGKIELEPKSVVSKRGKLILPHDMEALPRPHKHRDGAFNYTPFEAYNPVGTSLFAYVSNLTWWVDSHRTPDYNPIAAPSVAELYDAMTIYGLHSLKNLSVVFSANGWKGAWDMATISMRGIKSCQSWSKTKYSPRLIGSILDPCAGVIYLTDGKETKRGPRMLGRAIVRLIGAKQDRSEKDYRAHLFLERSYAGAPFNEDGHYLGAFYQSLFHRTLSTWTEELKLRMSLWTKPSQPSMGFIPQGAIEVPEHLESYVDSDWTYKRSAIKLPSHSKSEVRQLQALFAAVNTSV